MNQLKNGFNVWAMLGEHDPFVRFHVRRILCGVLPSAKCPGSHPSCVTRNDSFPSTLEAHVFFGSALEIVSVQWVSGGCAPQIIVLLSIAQIDINLTMEACGSLMFIKTSSWNSMIMSLQAYYQHHEHEHNRTASVIWHLISRKGMICSITRIIRLSQSF